MATAIVTLNHIIISLKVKNQKNNYSVIQSVNKKVVKNWWANKQRLIDWLIDFQSHDLIKKYEHNIEKVIKYKKWVGRKNTSSPLNLIIFYVNIFTYWTYDNSLNIQDKKKKNQ